MSKGRVFLVVFLSVFVGLVGTAAAEAAEEACITCHEKIGPGQVADWRVSRHASVGVTCSVCHGDAHTSAADAANAVLPDEHKCGECHELQYTQFAKGKHNHGWTSLNAIPATHLAPNELIEGGAGLRRLSQHGHQDRGPEEGTAGQGVSLPEQFL